MSSIESAEAIVSPPVRVRRSHAQTLLLALAVIVLNAFGNVSLKWGVKHIAVTLGLNPADYIRAMINPFVAAGICLLILWLLTRMALMSWAELSFVLPVTAIGYVLAAVLGHLFLHEEISLQRWIGTLLIFVGALLVGATSQKTAGREREP